MDTRHRRLVPISLRARTLIAFALMLVLLIAILQLLAESIMLRGFNEVEERAVRDRVEQASNGLSSSIARISQANRDYSEWDETYSFMVSHDPEYWETHIGSEVMANLGLTYIAFVSPSGEVVFATGFDRVTEEEVPPPPQLTRFDGANARLLQHDRPEGSLEGVILLDQPMLLAAQPILTSRGEGPVRGTLLMGRTLDDTEVAQLATITRLPISVARLDRPAASPALQRAIETLSSADDAVFPLDEQQILGATRVPDIFGGPGLLLYMELPRAIHQLGLRARNEYTLVLMGASLIFGAVALALLELTILRRTVALSAQVARVDIGHPNARVTVGGPDEIGQLGDAINQMLQRLVQAQEHLVESELRYRQLIELIPDAIIVHDGRRIMYTNPAGSALFGHSSADGATGQPLDGALAAVTPHADGSPMWIEQVLKLPSGASIEAEIIAQPFQDRDLPAVQVIVRNISERKQVEQTLRQAKEAADAASRAKSQFLATMSHELRTPLTTILGYAELLERSLPQDLGAEARDDLGRIRNAGTHLLALINDVLDLSQIDAGQLLVRHQPVAVAPLLQSALEVVQPLAEKNGNHISIQRAPGAELIVSDGLRLRQILINLLSNACKFTHGGAIRVEASLVPGPGGAQLCVAVHDTGIGIPPEQLGRLFSDFVQIDASSTRKYGGSGLGLALSRCFARLLGGDITCASEPGVGSTFTLTLPVGELPADARPPQASEPAQVPA